MGLFNFRKLLAGKTKKAKRSPSHKRSKKVKKTVTKSKTGKRGRPSPSRSGKKGKRTQRAGGGNYRLDVAKNCKIGGLPVVSPVNECPKGVGPADPAFGTAIYTHPIVGGGKKKKH